MKTVKFTVLGEAHGKGRPRVVSRNGFSRAYTPKQTVLYENLIRVEYEIQTESYRFSDGAFLEMRLDVYHGIPKSVSKKRREQLLSNEIRPIRKSDCDNILKCFGDAIQGIAYKDDTQIVECKVYKWYSDEPRVEVTIKELGVDPAREK